MLILNPKIDGDWTGTTVISTRDPLWPVELLHKDVVDLPVNVAIESKPRAFTFVADRVFVENVRMETTCANGFCDGRYGCACPCTRHRAAPLVIPAIILRCKEVTFATYSSSELALLMFVKDDLLSSSSSRNSLMAMATHVKNQLESHVGGLRIWGWIKPAVHDGDESATLGKAHISRVAVIGASLIRYDGTELLENADNDDDADDDASNEFGSLVDL